MAGQQTAPAEGGNPRQGKGRRVREAGEEAKSAVASARTRAQTAIASAAPHHRAGSRRGKMRRRDARRPAAPAAPHRPVDGRQDRREFRVLANRRWNLRTASPSATGNPRHWCRGSRSPAEPATPRKAICGSYAQRHETGRGCATATARVDWPAGAAGAAAPARTTPRRCFRARHTARA